MFVTRVIRLINITRRITLELTRLDSNKVFKEREKHFTHLKLAFYIRAYLFNKNDVTIHLPPK